MTSVGTTIWHLVLAGLNPLAPTQQPAGHDPAGYSLNVDRSALETLLLVGSGLGVTVYHGTGLIIVLGGWSWVPRWAAALMGGEYPIEGPVRRATSVVFLALMTLVGISVLVVIPIIVARRGGLGSPASWLVLVGAWVLAAAWFAFLLLRRPTAR